MTENQIKIKRLFDIAFSVVGLFLFWPLILICIVIARIDTRHSGIFTQKRVGQHGRYFNVHKIRTMTASSGNGGSTVTVVYDPRITRSGAIMRKLKFDELPQLWNVLLGEMSFVGPRPDVPGYADKLVGEAREILNLRPGITGPATLCYRDEEKILAEVNDPVTFNDTIIFPDKVRINLNYYQNWSFRLDIVYILVTLKILPLAFVPSQSSVEGNICK